MEGFQYLTVGHVPMRRADCLWDPHRNRTLCDRKRLETTGSGNGNQKRTVSSTRVVSNARVLEYLQQPQIRIFLTMPVSVMSPLYSHNARMMHWKLLWQTIALQLARHTVASICCAYAYWEFGKRKKTKRLIWAYKCKKMNYDIT